jgi:sRNA-binding protein
MNDFRKFRKGQCVVLELGNFNTQCYVIESTGDYIKLRLKYGRVFNFTKEHLAFGKITR